MATMNALSGLDGGLSSWLRREKPPLTRSAGEYGAQYPKAVTTLEQHGTTLLTFFDFPAEQWKHLRISNVIESPFPTVRLPQQVGRTQVHGRPCA
jgi:hypothetical protein